MKVSVEKLEPNWWNPNVLSEEEFEDLQVSIQKTEGKWLKYNPLLVRKLNNGHYQILDGEKRWKAAKKLGFEELWVKVLEVDEERAKRLTVVLNKDRGYNDYFLLSRLLCDDYYELEEKRGTDLKIKRDENGEPVKSGEYTQEELGEQYGYSGSTVSHILPIYPRLKNLLNPEEFSNAQLMELAKVKNDNFRKLLVEKVKDTNWTSITISSRATRFNQLTDFLAEKISNQELYTKVLNKLVEELGSSILEYDYSALKNEAEILLEEEKKKRIIHGDMFEQVQELDRKFDCIITDPPYSLSWKREFNLEGRKNINQDKGKWDHFTKEKYLAFTEQWIKTITPVLREGGTILIFTSDLFLSHILDILMENGFEKRNTIVWKKQNPVVSVEQNCFVSSVEYIAYATKKGGSRTFNWLGQKQSHNLLKSPVAKNPVHPTQKPVALIKKLLKFVTNPESWVLDPFAGSGSTAVACEELKRNWTMIEKEEKYVKMIKRRVTK